MGDARGIFAIVAIAAIIFGGAMLPARTRERLLAVRSPRWIAPVAVAAVLVVAVVSIALERRA